MMIFCIAPYRNEIPIHTRSLIAQVKHATGQINMKPALSVEVVILTILNP